MRRLIYISKSRIDDDPAQLDVIVARANVRNEGSGITGMLWSHKARFAQVLEGHPDSIAETMRRIEIDPRHTEIEIVGDRTIGQRMFGAWGMVRPDRGATSTAAVAFLIGFAAEERSGPARKMHDMLLECAD